MALWESQPPWLLILSGVSFFLVLMIIFHMCMCWYGTILNTQGKPSKGIHDLFSCSLSISHPFPSLRTLLPLSDPWFLSFSYNLKKKSSLAKLIITTFKDIHYPITLINFMATILVEGTIISSLHYCDRLFTVLYDFSFAPPLDPRVYFPAVASDLVKT